MTRATFPLGRPLVPRPPRPDILPGRVVARFLRAVPFVFVAAGGSTWYLIPRDSRGVIVEGEA